MELQLAQDEKSAWNWVLEPWLRERLQEGALDRVLLVVPHTQRAMEVKARCLAVGVAWAGIELCTPKALRKRLLGQAQQTQARIAVREDLHLLMQLSAKELQTQWPQGTLAAQAPASWVQLYDVWVASGRSLNLLPSSFAKTLLQAFEKRLIQSGLTSIHVHDWNLLKSGRLQPLPTLWFYGFSAGDYAQWPLLYAGIQATTTWVRACLWSTGDDAWDALWLETWEKALQTQALWVEPSDPGSFACILEGPNGDAAEGIMGLECHDPVSQAQAIATQVGSWLGEPQCTRIGVVFPTGSPAAACVSQTLSNQGILHHDAFGRPRAQGANYLLLSHYLGWQQDPRLTVLEPFLEQIHEQGLIELDVFLKIQKTLRNRFLSTLKEDLQTLFAEPKETLQAFLADWPLWPESAPLALFWQRLKPLLERLEYPYEAFDWVGSLEVSCSRSFFAQWAQERLRQPGRSPLPEGHHPLSRVHLLPWHAALGSCFSHVLVADGVQSAWSVPDFPLLNTVALPPQTEASLNSLPILGPAYTQALQAATLEHLVRTATQGFAVSCFHSDLQGQPTTPQRFLKNLISEPVVPQASLGRKTSFPAHKDFVTLSPAPEALAYCAGRPLVLSAKAWEATWHYPEQVWLEKVLNSPELVAPESQDPSAIARGTWVHALLAQALGHGRVEPNSVRQRFKGALNQLWRQRASSAWELYFDTARTAATQLLEKLLRERAGYWAATEIPLPEGTQVLIPQNAQTLPLTGRIDLLLSATPLPRTLKNLDPESVFEIIDFKTGSDPALSLKKLEAGHGLQLALYGLALQAHGAGPQVHLLLLHPEGPWPKGLALPHTFDLNTLWDTLALRSRSGCLSA